LNELLAIDDVDDCSLLLNGELIVVNLEVDVDVGLRKSFVVVVVVFLS
jgi:hypothetical protein